MRTRSETVVGVSERGNNLCLRLRQRNRLGFQRRKSCCSLQLFDKLSCEGEKKISSINGTTLKKLQERGFPKIHSLELQSIVGLGKINGQDYLAVSGVIWTWNSDVPSHVCSQRRDLRSDLCCFGVWGSDRGSVRKSQCGIRWQ